LGRASGRFPERAEHGDMYRKILIMVAAAGLGRAWLPAPARPRARARHGPALAAHDR
jgi:hypothetical protein